MPSFYHEANEAEAQEGQGVNLKYRGRCFICSGPLPPNQPRAVGIGKHVFRIWKLRLGDAMEPISRRAEIKSSGSYHHAGLDVFSFGTHAICDLLTETELVHCAK